MSVKKILVVDDSLTDLTRIQQILNNKGYQVITANSGLEAIEKAKSNLPDVIFMDVVMDDKNGFQACRELQKEEITKNIPIFLVSSKSQKVDHLYAKQVGARELIPKPYEEAQILEKLNSL